MGFCRELILKLGSPLGMSTERSLFLISDIFSGDPLKVRLQALPKNIRLGWKGLLRTNALAYYEYL